MLKVLVGSVALCGLCPLMAFGQLLTPNLEIKRVENVGANWITIPLENTYSDAIVVCTYNLSSSVNPPAVTRIRNVAANSFDLRIQQFENSSVVTPNDVHCIISDEGAYDTGGLKYEARKVLSIGTSGQAVGWDASTTEDVSAAITQTYINPHAIGQVMTFNDVNASVFWNFDCETRGNGAFFSGQADGICVGKHIGQIDGVRANETLGYIVVDESTGSLNGINFAAAVGPDTIAGVGNAPPFNYAVSGDFDIGVVSNAGEDGGQGGWAVLYGNDPLPNNTVSLAIDEEVVAGDTSRSHTTENVGYWIFENNQTANINADKTVSIFNGSASPYAIPGSDVIYEIFVENVGNGSVDNNSIFLVDRLPPEIVFYNGDIDDGGPETEPVIFADAGSRLSFALANSLGFSNAATAPTNMAQCNYTPAAGYDPLVTFICLAPQGQMSEGVITPSSFTLQFRAQLD